MALARFSRLALTSCVAVGHTAFKSAETAGVRDMREAYQQGHVRFVPIKIFGVLG